MRSRFALGWLAAAAIAAGPARAQGLPPYQSVNPLLTSRSGLYFQPYVDRGKPWSFRVLTDYASLVEFAELPRASMVIDAEISRVDLTVTRNLGAGFAAASLSHNGVYPGFMDGFLDWYHDLTGLQVKARTLRPRNEYQFTIDLPNGPDLVRARPSGYFGDLRLVAGHRHSRFWQSVVSVTVPAGAPTGFGRKGPSVSAITTVRTSTDRRIVGEFSAGIGYTPARGDLEAFQETDFHHLSAGARLRVIGRQAIFANLFYQSRNYQGTTMRPLDQRELTLDYGFLLRAKKGPEWFLGMTEDLEPKGPAIDLSFRIGARW